jgi:hypothetical protein
VVPPSVVATIIPEAEFDTPTAKQVVGPGQAIPRSPTDVGRTLVCGLQVRPEAAFPTTVASPATRTSSSAPPRHSTGMSCFISPPFPLGWARDARCPLQLPSKPANLARALLTGLVGAKSTGHETETQDAKHSGG